MEIRHFSFRASRLNIQVKRRSQVPLIILRRECMLWRSQMKGAKKMSRNCLPDRQYVHMMNSSDIAGTIRRLPSKINPLHQIPCAGRESVIQSTKIPKIPPTLHMTPSIMQSASVSRNWFQQLVTYPMSKQHGNPCP